MAKAGAAMVCGCCNAPVEGWELGWGRCRTCGEVICYRCIHVCESGRSGEHECCRCCGAAEHHRCSLQRESHLDGSSGRRRARARTAVADPAALPLFPEIGMTTE
ncbi:MAG: hypothetical protein HY660_13295 [Armatimonadetes bacterium]|nr:hypothetical protein [Armatimonadota bacterium]